MIWALACSTAAFIRSREYFPDPRINLEVNSWFPIFQVSFVWFIFLPSFLSFPFCFLFSCFRSFRSFFPSSQGAWLSLPRPGSSLQDQFQDQVCLMGSAQGHPGGCQSLSLLDPGNPVSAEIKIFSHLSGD